MADHPVTAGDCFSSVSAENGFYNYLTLYNRNPELKAKRPNPNMLVPGDVISTGTCAGVGAARGRFLVPGDVMAAEVEGIGVLENPVRRA